MKQSKLLEIEARLKKAYSLPKSEQEKYKKHIDELERQAKILRFDDGEAVRELIRANRRIAMITAERRYNGRFAKFLNENKELGERFNISMVNLDIAYREKDMMLFEGAVKNYEKTVLEIDKLYIQTQATGFREYVEGEIDMEKIFGSEK